ncbi:hypothetical protein ES703_109412 [subsurface metagenome]
MASKEPKAPFSNSTSMNAASSTVTFPFSLPFVAALKVPAATSSESGLSETNCFVIAMIDFISPTRYRARSTLCEFRSPCGPEPAVSFLRCHVRGKVGSVIHDWRYAPRQWNICPILHSSISFFASLTAGHLL